MKIYMVAAKSENKGQFFKNKDKAERQAGYKNDIPDGIEYTVKEVEIKEEFYV